MNLFLYNAFRCACRSCIIQLLIFLLTTIILYSSGENYSINYVTMPVTTRSMMKRGLQPSSASVGILTSQTCCTDGTLEISSMESPIIIPDSLLSLPDLVDQCNASSSSSEASSSSNNSVLLEASDHSSNMALHNFETLADFENFDFENLESSINTPTQTVDHNLENSQFVAMPSGSTDDMNPSVKADDDPSSQENILQHLHLISNQMLSNYQDLQNQIAQSEMKFSVELAKVTQANDTFRQEICSELSQVTSSMSVSTSATTQANSTNVIPNTSTTSTSVPVSSPSSQISNQDFQTQMMTLLTTTFSKLTTVIDSKSLDTKSEWPKFGGDMKKFKNWQLAILAQLSLSPWSELYDPSNNTLFFKSHQIINSMRNFMPSYCFVLKVRCFRIWYPGNISVPMDYYYSKNLLRLIIQVMFLKLRQLKLQNFGAI
jgi:hypothetical protein